MIPVTTMTVCCGKICDMPNKNSLGLQRKGTTKYSRNHGVSVLRALKGADIGNITHVKQLHIVTTKEIKSKAILRLSTLL